MSETVAAVNAAPSRRSPLRTDSRLRIDNVLATQPEAGPVVPDGGYGWIILVGAFYVKNIISGLVVAYGLLLMFYTLETGTTNSGIYNLWSSHITSAPILYVIVRSLSDPLCHHIVRSSKWPRFVALVGICLICASILMLWLSIVDGFARRTLCAVSGIFAGFGSSLVFVQIDESIAQYFRLKLPAVQAVLRLAEYTGMIYTGLVLGKYLSMYGIGHSIIWYHLIVLTSGMIVLVFKKPDYLKGQQVYRVIGRGHTEDDDEEDIFSKNGVTELQSPHTSLSATINEDSTSTTTTIISVQLESQASTQSQRRKNWETFDEDDEAKTKTANKDDDDEDRDELPAPRELFTEGQINNNVTYSFENADHTVGMPNGNEDTTNIFLPVSRGGVSHSYLYNLTFYNKCLLEISITGGIFVFFTLFPSYLFYSVNFLHKESVAHILSIILMASLIEACFIGCWKFSKVNRSLPIAVLLLINATGHFLISDWKKEMLIVIGGILITTSSCALQFLSKSIIVNSRKARLEYAALKIFTAIAFLILFIINPSYENCFRLVGLLQVTSGSINFCVFIYGKISTMQ